MTCSRRPDDIDRNGWTPLISLLAISLIACGETIRQETVTWQYQVFGGEGTVSVSVPADGWVWDSTSEALGTDETLEVLKLLRTTADDGPHYAYITIYTVPLDVESLKSAHESSPDFVDVSYQDGQVNGLQAVFESYVVCRGRV